MLCCDIVQQPRSAVRSLVFTFSLTPASTTHYLVSPHPYTHHTCSYTSVFYNGAASNAIALSAVAVLLVSMLATWA